MILSTKNTKKLAGQFFCQLIEVVRVEEGVAVGVYICTCTLCLTERVRVNSVCTPKSNMVSQRVRTRESMGLEN